MTTIAEFLRDLFDATRGIPSAMRQSWKDAHRWDRPKYIYERVDYDDKSSALVAKENPDYTLWRRLGPVSDALIVLILVLIVLMVFI